MKYLFVLSVLTLLVSACAEKKNEKIIAVDKIPVMEAPDNAFALPVHNFDTLEKEYLSITNDTTYIINFWATWCKPCVKELPAFERIGEAYVDKHVKVVLVSLDFPENIETRVLPFIEKNGLKSEVILLDDPDANAWIPKVDSEWSGAIPATIILNKKMKSFYERSFSFEELEKELKTML